jgi:hypothetical protein
MYSNLFSICLSFEVFFLLSFVCTWNNYGTAIKFICRGVYYECGCSCTSVILQEGGRRFKKGMPPEYHAKLLFVSIMIYEPVKRGMNL